MPTIRIAGGGIAGLTCAINLADRGITVEDHEAKRYCGKGIRDIEYLENWSLEEDALDTLMCCGLDPTFDHHAVYSFKRMAGIFRVGACLARMVVG